MVNVGGQPSGRVRETVKKDIKDCEVTGAGSKCEFELKIPGICYLQIFLSLKMRAAKISVKEIRN